MFEECRCREIAGLMQQEGGRVPELEKKRVRTSEGLKEYTYLGCPLTRNRSAWCFRLCIPDEGGHGDCGRIAPHSFKSRIQMGIEKHNREQLAKHFRKLELMYLSAPCNDPYKLGISVSEGESEIVLPIKETFLTAARAVHASMCLKVLDDAARYAVQSTVDTVAMITMAFNIYLTRPIVEGELIAHGHLMNVVDKEYLAESVLTNADGEELGRGNGAYVKSSVRLSSEIGYR